MIMPKIGEVVMKRVAENRKHLILCCAIAFSSGCAAEEPARELGTEHYAGAAAARTPEVHRGMIATTAGPREIEYEVFDGKAILEGDIVVPWSDLLDLLDPHVAHAATVTRELQWPGGVVPFVVDANLPNPQRVVDAIAHWHDLTPLRLVPRTTQANFVRFVDGSGCSSYVGRVGGVQTITLNAACSTGNAIHEIGHAFGLWHEQSRKDRDAHVVINPANISTGCSTTSRSTRRGWTRAPTTSARSCTTARTRSRRMATRLSRNSTAL